MPRATKSVENLQRRNGKLLQQIDCLQDDYERAVEEERQQHKLLNAEVANCDAMGHHHSYSLPNIIGSTRSISRADNCPFLEIDCAKSIRQKRRRGDV